MGVPLLSRQLPAAHAEGMLDVIWVDARPSVENRGPEPCAHPSLPRLELNETWGTRIFSYSKE